MARLNSGQARPSMQAGPRHRPTAAAAANRGKDDSGVCRRGLAFARPHLLAVVSQACTARSSTVQQDFALATLSPTDPVPRGLLTLCPAAQGLRFRTNEQRQRNEQGFDMRLHSLVFSV